jgi:hypothetical protein
METNMKQNIALAGVALVTIAGAFALASMNIINLY